MAAQRRHLSRRPVFVLQLVERAKGLYKLETLSKHQMSREAKAPHHGVCAYTSGQACTSLRDIHASCYKRPEKTIG